MDQSFGPHNHHVSHRSLVTCSFVSERNEDDPRELLGLDGTLGG
jgi:hypothetical protein